MAALEEAEEVAIEAGALEDRQREDHNLEYLLQVIIILQPLVSSFGDLMWYHMLPYC